MQQDEIFVDYRKPDLIERGIDLYSDDEDIDENGDEEENLDIFTYIVSDNSTLPSTNISNSSANLLPDQITSLKKKKRTEKRKNFISFTSSILSLLNDVNYSDVIITNNKNSYCIYSHKIILASRSNYFKQLIEKKEKKLLNNNKSKDEIDDENENNRISLLKFTEKNKNNLSDEENSNHHIISSIDYYPTSSSSSSSSSSNLNIIPISENSNLSTTSSSPSYSYSSSTSSPSTSSFLTINLPSYLTEKQVYVMLEFFYANNIKNIDMLSSDEIIQLFEYISKIKEISLIKYIEGIIIKKKLITHDNFCFLLLLCSSSISKTITPTTPYSFLLKELKKYIDQYHEELIVSENIRSEIMKNSNLGLLLLEMFSIKEDQLHEKLINVHLFNNQNNFIQDQIEIEENLNENDDNKYGIKRSYNDLLERNNSNLDNDNEESENDNFKRSKLDSFSNLSSPNLSQYNKNLSNYHFPSANSNSPFMHISSSSSSSSINNSNNHEGLISSVTTTSSSLSETAYNNNSEE